MSDSVAAPAAPKSLVMKLAEVMAAVERVPKNGWNDFHKYHYATEADIAEAIRKELAARNVILIPSIESMVREAVGEKGQVLTTLSMTFTFLDGDTGEELKRAWMGAGTDKEDKGLYKATTGGEKYFLLKTFLVPTGDDPEKHDAGSTGAASPEARRGRQAGPKIGVPIEQVGDPNRKSPPTTDAEVYQAFPQDIKPVTVDARELWKKDERDCPACGAKGSLRKGAKQYGGGVYCDRTTGCGYKWKDTPPWKPEIQAAPTGGDLPSSSRGESSSGGVGRTDDNRPPREHLVSLIRQTVKVLDLKPKELQSLKDSYTAGKVVDDATDDQLEKLYLFLGDGEAVAQWRAQVAA